MIPVLALATTDQAEDRGPALRTPEAARYCGFAPRSFENMRASGTGPRFHKKGRVIVYRLADLRAWLDRFDQFDGD